MGFFSVINEENFESTVNSLFKDERDRVAVFDFFSQTELFSEMEFAIASSNACLLVRIFDGEFYAFAFPEPLLDTSDVAAALSEIEKYVIREEIPFELVSVPKDALPYLSSYRHIRLDSADETGELFYARVENECSILDEKPSHIGGRVILNALTEGDIADYARLCRDEKLLLYWGYDYRLDYNGKDDRFFFDMAEAEFDSGVALTLAVRSGAKLVGSLEFYAFDFHGSAELDVRIFPHEQGKGYASGAVEGAIDIAKQMGLTKLCATVMNNNAHSLALFEKYSTQKRANKKTTVFTIDI